MEGSGGEGGSRPRPRALQRPPARTSPLPTGAAGTQVIPLRPLPPRSPARSAPSPFPSGPGGCGRRVGPAAAAGDGAPFAPGATVDRGGLSSVRPNRVAPPRAGTGPRPSERERKGSAAMSATHPTRLETRTKESNARASQRVASETPRRNESEGRRAPAEVGSRGGASTPPPAGRTTGPSRPPRRGGGA